MSQFHGNVFSSNTFSGKIRGGVLPMKIFKWPAIVLLSRCPAYAGTTVSVEKSLPGDGNWDYLIVDSPARHVYVSHGNEVNVLDADPASRRKDTQHAGVHGMPSRPNWSGLAATTRGRVHIRPSAKTLGGAQANPDAPLRTHAPAFCL